jgi:RNA polymerase sigma-70 factor, ECF subfamily
MSDQKDPFSAALIASLPRLRRYATGLVGKAGAADDLVQDCIERALRRSDSLRDPERIGGWLRSILHNLYIDGIRRGRDLANGIEISDLDNTLSTPPDDRSVSIDFLKGFDTLSVEHRQILLLVGLEGLNYREISEELNIPIGTVMSRLARARERLREALERETKPASITQLDSVRRAKR